MHVTIATLLACLGWGAGRIWRVVTTLFALAIAIGAIHLGWHYASDVIAGAVLAVVFWVAAGWVSRYTLAMLPMANRPAESIA
jgi:membrane-associated phospholipid phosphatase